MPNQSQVYVIRIKGILDPQWRLWFDDMSVVDSDNETVISGPVADQAALHGLLGKIRDLGLQIIDMRSK